MKVDLMKLLQLHAQIERHGVRYGLGAKARMDAKPGQFSKIDCSGYARLLLHQASGGKLTIPDGSQNQRAWFEAHDGKDGIRKVNYRDIGENVGKKGQRLFVAFIKPNTNGCGAVGHIWFVTNADEDTQAETIESHGGTGPNSRPWNTGVLMREVYCAYEIEVS